MAKKEKLKAEMHKVFSSNLIYLITGSGFFVIFIVGFVLNFSAFNLFAISVLGAMFFYIFSIIILSKLLAYGADENVVEPAKYDRAVYKYNLLYWKLKSQLTHNEVEDFQRETDADMVEDGVLPEDSK